MLEKIKSWNPPEEWIKITTFDIHTAGEPLRIVTGGVVEPAGATILEKRNYMKENLDHIRTSLMLEPRGHREMYGCILTAPASQDSDFGVIFMHTEGYSTMCGHGIIGISKVAVETGIVECREPETIIKIDTPAGLVTSHVVVENNKIRSVYFDNVVSFVLALDETVYVDGIGEVRYDLAFGGAFYAFVDAETLSFRCTPEESLRLIEKGMAIKNAIIKKRIIQHPIEDDLSFLYGTIFIAPPMSEDADSRNVCIFANGQLDRSPTGTGVSARMAIHHARGEIGVGEKMVIESIVGARFIGSVVEQTRFGQYDAVIPRVEGTSYICGKSEFFIDPEDSLKDGFILP